MAGFRLTRAAVADIDAILAWSDEQFGKAAMRRYEALLVVAIHDAASGAAFGRKPHPELGNDVFSWHLRQSRSHTQSTTVRHPRHLLLCRQKGELLIIARVLHDSMDPERHLLDTDRWD